MRRTSEGLTYLELVIVLTVLCIFLGAASISISQLIAKTRLESAAQTIYSDLRFAQSESLNHNKTIFVSFIHENEKWCYGFSENKSCDCTKANECKIGDNEKVVTHETFKGVEIQKSRFAGNKNYTAFSPRNGFAVANGAKNGTIWLKKDDMQIAVIVNRLGRVRFCSPTLTEYSQQCPKAP